MMNHRYPASQFSPCWESILFPLHFLRLLCQVVNYCEVTYLDVYVPSEEEKKNPRLYANNVRALMAKEMGVPAVESTLEVRDGNYKLYLDRY